MTIDSHAHLDDKAYGDVGAIMDNFISSGGKTLIDVGCDEKSCFAAKRTAERFGVYFSAGIHPQEADKDIDIGLIAPLLTDKRCVAVGEIGLDYHYKPFDRKRQIDLFERQIFLACENELPIIIHSREASEDMLATLKNNKAYLKNGFLMHCYSESKEQAKRYLDLGAYFAFGGAITFKNAKKDDVIKSIPVDRLLFETDCPYMTPEPLRGRVNEPAFVGYVYAKAAAILDIDREVLERVIEENFVRFFKKVAL
ncbi:MAG: TatD family hydrolase [Clostridia bacterium]|nr:TatD family hydrolase [Clostridia bacterium]